MDNKFYVSYEAARLLKEKGYNNYSTVYDCSVEGNILLNQHPMYGEWAGDKDVYPCPTKAEAIDWLESKGMCIVVFKRTIDNKVEWRYVIHDHTEIISGFSTRLQAEEAAIIKALELI